MIYCPIYQVRELCFFGHSSASAPQAVRAVRSPSSPPSPRSSGGCVGLRPTPLARFRVCVFRRRSAKPHRTSNGASKLAAFNVLYRASVRRPLGAENLTPPAPDNNRGGAGRASFLALALVLKKQKNLAEILQGFVSTVRANKKTDHFQDARYKLLTVEAFAPPAKLLYHTSKSLSREKKQISARAR